MNYNAPLLLSSKRLGKFCTWGFLYLKSFESRLTIFLSYSFIQRARAGALVLVSLHLP